MLTLNAHAWNVNYYKDAQCRGEILREDTYDQTGNTCIAVDTFNIVSAVVTDKLPGQTLITFYTGSDCSGTTLGIQTGEGCSQFPINGFGSVGLTS